jgi:hypothetical protein
MADDKGGLSGNATLGIGLVICAGLVVAAIVGMRFMSTPPPPPAPRVAAAPETVLNTSLKFTEGYYKATLEDDAKKLGLSIPPMAEMSAPFPYANELPAPRIMKLDHDVLETPHLKIATKTVKEWSTTGSAQNMRVEHVMLFITNKTQRPLAYKVDTTLSGDLQRCRSKAVLVQNAIALRPGETIERSECFWYKNETFSIKSVEVLELPELSYYYVSRLTPGQVLLDERAATGHVAPKKEKACTFVPWREIKQAAEVVGGVSWGDVLDFYARHNCDEYSYFNSYRRWTTPGVLPAKDGAPPSQALETSKKSE